MSVRSILTTITAGGRDAVVRWYFATSYRALATPAGREFLRAAAAPGAPAVHGYSTADDVAALLEALQPSPRDTVVDLGCGFGEVAIDVHRRAGCRVIGVDASRRAIEEAQRRADAAQIGTAVRFEVGRLGSSPIRGSAAYALDSLMFVRNAPDVLASIARSLEPPGRIFGAIIDHRGRDLDAFARYVAGSHLRVERIEDVTEQFARRSRRRAAAARSVLRSQPPRAGRAGMLLVVGEEAIVTLLIGLGRLRRWRFTTVLATVPAESTPDGSGTSLPG